MNAWLGMSKMQELSKNKLLLVIFQVWCDLQITELLCMWFCHVSLETLFLF